MKVFDTIIKANLVFDKQNSRENSGLVHAYCHEANVVARKENKSDRYYVLSNKFNNSYILKRSLTENTDLEGVSVSYDTKQYSDYILFQGSNEEQFKKIKLSDNFTRYVFNKKIMNKVKKIIVQSNKGKRYLHICRTEFKNIPANINIENNYINGFGGRLSYGCGLLIPTKVYSHLLNFVK